MEANPQSRVKLGRELFYRLKAISTRKGKDVPECIEEWVVAEEVKRNGVPDE
jgi:hypothetical protein